MSDGVQSKLLEFYEDSDETANGIRQALTTCLKKYELDLNRIAAYAADNANINLGKTFLRLPVIAQCKQWHFES